MRSCAGAEGATPLILASNNLYAQFTRAKCRSSTSPAAASLNIIVYFHLAININVARPQARSG